MRGRKTSERERANERMGIGIGLKLTFVESNAQILHKVELRPNRALVTPNSPERERERENRNEQNEEENRRILLWLRDI